MNYNSSTLKKLKFSNFSMMTVNARRLCQQNNSNTNDKPTISPANQNKSGFNLNINVNQNLAQNSSNKPSQPNQHYKHCFDVVRTVDYPNYFSTLFMKKEERDAVLSLRAFNIEIAKIKSLASSTEAGEMRMYYWKTVISSILKGEKGEYHPVSWALFDTLNKYKLAYSFLNTMITARTKDLSSKQPKDLDSLVDYCEKSSSSMLYLTLQILGVNNTHADHCASHLGKAFGLVTILRGIPFHSESNETYIPQDLSLKYLISQNELSCNIDISEKLKEPVFDIANLAHNHLQWARKMKGDVPKEAIPAFLFTAFLDDYLERLRVNEFNPYLPVLQYGAKPRIIATKNYYSSNY